MGKRSMEPVDPDEIRRRGIRKIIIGLAILGAMIVGLFVLAPLYGRG
jgi:hypothetical protein